MKTFKQHLTEKNKFKGMVIQSLADFLEEEAEEIAEAKLGSDIPLQDYETDALIGNLSRSETGAKKKSDKFKHPRIHGSTAKDIKITNEQGEEYDLNKLRTMLTQVPSKILKKNEKMSNSVGEDVQFYNLGLPAIKGLLFDEDDKKFKIVSTCPMAGECQRFCYAHKGGYIQWKGSSVSTNRLLNLLINKPDVFEALLSKELKSAVKSASKSNTKVVLRWHDTGDFFSPSYTELAFKIASKFPEVDFYAYTKNAGVASGSKPDNFIFNFSAGAKGSETRKIDFDTTKNSRVVQKDVFWDLVLRKGSKLIKDSKGRMQYNSEADKQELKNRVAKLYHRNVKDVITYEELMKMKPGSKMRWSVIVASGDGDDAATRRDVRDTLLLIH